MLRFVDDIFYYLTEEQKVLDKHLGSYFSEITAAIQNYVGETQRPQKPRKGAQRRLRKEFEGRQSYREENYFTEIKLNKKFLQQMSDKNLYHFLSIVALTMIGDDRERRYLYYLIRERVKLHSNLEEFLPKDPQELKLFLLDKYYKSPHDLLRYCHSKFGLRDGTEVDFSQLLERFRILVISNKEKSYSKRIQRHKGYRDKGSLGVEQPNAYIEDSLALKREEERSEYKQLLLDTEDLISGMIQ